ncbi:hypothetical protein LDJ79_05700 [Vibrio tritonius]|uniref:Uncharacterized protein n=1 Tax=Vibrio tritonius TaxID=1435069 RepID=A0ABS7YIU0_9VIBR|nr:hypothetical protein [Vibrio tritonius]MCA2015596.1 hypothetical protein [Vibrio tritonius]
MKIEVSQKTYERLSELAKGFDTPDSVISRLLDSVAKIPTRKPTITFDPTSERDFKSALLETRLAEVCISYDDESTQFLVWNAEKFKDSSNLKANLWSGFLRGWKEKGITRITLKILDSSTDRTVLKIGHALGLSYADAVVVQPRYHQEDEDTYLIWFENEDLPIINKVKPKVNNDLEVYLPTLMLDL